jgi:hypothetical protein
MHCAIIRFEEHIEQFEIDPKDYAVHFQNVCGRRRTLGTDLLGGVDRRLVSVCH